jgi:ribose transport system permease protein
MTLGMGGAIQGLVLVYTHGGFAASPPRSLVELSKSEALGVPLLVLVWIGVAVAGTVLLSGTAFGRRLYAVGTNARAALLAGIAVKRVLLVPYVVSAVGAALTGVLLLGYRGQAFNNMGDEYLFSAAVAVAVGGTSILGGRGHYLGTVAGALILILVVALLPLFGLGTAAVQVSYGVILIAAVLLANVSRGGSRNA